MRGRLRTPGTGHQTLPLRLVEIVACSRPRVSWPMVAIRPVSDVPVLGSHRGRDRPIPPRPGEHRAAAGAPRFTRYGGVRRASVVVDPRRNAPDRLRCRGAPRSSAPAWAIDRGLQVQRPVPFSRKGRRRSTCARRSVALSQLSEPRAPSPPAKTFSRRGRVDDSDSGPGGSSGGFGRSGPLEGMKCQLEVPRELEGSCAVRSHVAWP